MNFNIAPEVSKYFNWWIVTLKSCVPEQLQNQFKKYNKDVELIIRHQGDSVFLQDNHGEIIDSITMDGTEQDAGVDFVLGGADREEATVDDIDATHIDLSGHAEIIHHEFKKKETDLSNFTLDQIDLTERDESTIVFNRDDKTTRLMEMVSEDDTLVIQDEQGTLLNIHSDLEQARDNTILYYSDGGKIKAIDPEKDLKLAYQDVDVNVGRETASRESREDACLEFELAGSLLQKNPSNKKCLYLIPDDKVFSLVLNYPIETLENIENVLRYDLEKHIPLNFQEIRFFYALNVLSARNKVEVEVIVIKSRVYDHLVTAFESETEREIICTTRHFYEHYGTKINVLGSRSEMNPRSMLSLGNMHTTLNVVLLAVLLVLPYQISYQQLNSIQPKTGEEIKKAGEIVATVNQLNAEIELGKKLNREINKEHRVVELLASLSENIGTDAWITRFTYKNGEIKLKGEAVSATAVSDDLNDLGIFESIKFTSSIIKIPNTNKETFELALKLKSNA